MAKNILLLIISTCIFFSCKDDSQYKTALQDNQALVDANRNITAVMVHDIFSPPVSSRIYAYSSIAAYEVTALADPNYKSLMGQLNSFEEKTFNVPEECHYPLASLTAYYNVAKALVFSEEQIDSYTAELIEKANALGIPESVQENSIKLGKEMAQYVLSYASGDNYGPTRSYSKYTVTSEAETWKPTPPAYIEGIEPHWNQIRPFTLDSASQFKPAPPTAFDTKEGSGFFSDAKAVMDAGINLTKEQKDIAMFWDCNPYKMNIKGHVMFADKKITPGGHWMGIAGIAAKTKNLNWKETTEVMALTSISLFDAFISCWDEKYRSILIRPETYINQYMDKDWTPLLQTPPFPEYTSGHSVASKSAAIALTHLLGNEVHIVDSTEVTYGLPVREFNSFNQAASEAAISRFYGGIHYIPAIENGVDQGENVGKHVLSRVKTKNQS
ncbi:vanadium-dependent haloperoxidase [Echinicola shivajiensis]|uniref:vanadium-dependent haloperoxidase n=1 Tax=Echinicola shivajiensis TaxID=1035916 RepID=UPI001BFC5494|nr:vanadium-dependent haloperoxidase [Echinicola shivajiensis]